MWLQFTLLDVSVGTALEICLTKLHAIAVLISKLKEHHRSHLHYYNIIIVGVQEVQLYMLVTTESMRWDHDIDIAE